MLNHYNPNQPRNAEGEWTDAGGAIKRAASDNKTDPLKDEESTKQALDQLSPDEINKIIDRKERKVTAVSQQDVTRHAGHETYERVTAQTNQYLQIDDFGTMSTSQFKAQLMNKGRIPYNAKKGDFITNEHATKLLNDNKDLFEPQFVNTKELAQYYHKSKSNGTNHEFVNAVESAIKKHN